MQSTLWFGFSTLLLLIASVFGSARLILVCKLALAFSFIIAFIVRGGITWPVYSPTPVVPPRVCPPAAPPELGYSISLVSAVEIPPWSQLLLRGAVNAPPEMIGLVEAVVDSDLGYALPRAVCAVSPSGSVPLCVTNVSDVPVWLERGMHLGQFLPVEDPRPDVSTDEGVAVGVQSATSDSTPADRFDLSRFAGTAEQRQALVSLLNGFNDVIAIDDCDVGETPLLTHCIDTGATRPIRQGPRRLPPPRVKIVAEEVEKMLDKGIISPSVSPWASPIVLVQKPDGSIRFCVDYRKLNDATHKDSYPLPRIDDTLDRLGGAQYFSTLDLQSGYWQVPVEGKDQQKTAFITPQGLFEFRRMPFGLCNAPATFQRMMHAVLRGLSPLYCLVYLDDVIVFSRTFAEHLRRLEAVLTALRRAKLKIKPRKCHLLLAEVHFLGHVVSAKGISTDPGKVKAVQEWKQPASLKSLQSFLGFASYYRRFIPHFCVGGPSTA